MINEDIIPDDVTCPRCDTVMQLLNTGGRPRMQCPTCCVIMCEIEQPLRGETEAERVIPGWDYPAADSITVSEREAIMYQFRRHAEKAGQHRPTSSQFWPDRAPRSGPDGAKIGLRGERFTHLTIYERNTSI